LKSANIKTLFQKHQYNILAIINRWMITVKRNSRLGIVAFEEINYKKVDSEEIVSAEELLMSEVIQSEEKYSIL